MKNIVKPVKGNAWISKPRILQFAFNLMIAFIASIFIASTANALPWESPLQQVRQSISGPVATGISVIAIVAAGATLIWGGEISGFARTMVFIVLVVAVIVGANSIIGIFAG
ncbi:MAG: TrbC/VirB2 family protein [Proteobacteria bacterium]|nr:TrbC/VirB2 family protein [Pseudomonadota bacterium]